MENNNCMENKITAIIDNRISNMNECAENVPSNSNSNMHNSSPHFTSDSCHNDHRLI